MTMDHQRVATAPYEDEEIRDGEEAADARSKEWFKHNEGIPFEQVVGERSEHPPGRRPAVAG